MMYQYAKLSLYFLVVLLWVCVGYNGSYKMYQCTKLSLYF